MRAVILAAGTVRDYEYHRSLLQPDDTIICADGGMNHAKRMGIIPHYWLGDFDSYQTTDVETVPRITFPTKKDYTDMELAVRFALEKGYKDFLLLGGIGTRFDHSYANVCLLSYMETQGASGTIRDDKNCIRLIKDTLDIEGEKGEYVSLLPYTQMVTGVTTQGLEYPLENATMQKGYSLGVSNVMLGKKAFVEIKTGRLLCVQARD